MAPPVPFGVRVNDHAPAERSVRRTHDETVATYQRHRLGQPELPPGVLAGLQLVAVQQPQLGRCLHGVCMEGYGQVVTHGLGDVGEQADLGVQGLGRP